MNKKCWMLLCLLFVSFVSFSCAKSLIDDPNQFDPSKGLPFDVPKVIEGPAVTVKELQSVVNVVINSTPSDQWIYFSFAKKAKVDVAKPEDSMEWDVAFQRYKIKTNGGISGKGGVKVAILKNVAFEDSFSVAEDKFIVDEKDSEDVDTDPDYAFNHGDDKWFSYSIRDHVVKPTPFVFVLKSAEQKYYKIQFLGYYNENGVSGFPQFKWLLLNNQ